MPHHPQRFTKRPITIEALQFDGTLESHRAVDQFIGGAAHHEHWDARNWAFDPEVNEYIDTTEAPDLTTSMIEIHTLEGDMEANPGWWIIKGVKGEFYPCDPEVFAASYAPEPEHHSTGVVLPPDFEARSVHANGNVYGPTDPLF